MDTWGDDRRFAWMPDFMALEPRPPLCFFDKSNSAVVAPCSKIMSLICFIGSSDDKTWFGLVKTNWNSFSSRQVSLHFGLSPPILHHKPRLCSTPARAVFAARHLPRFRSINSSIFVRTREDTTWRTIFAVHAPCSPDRRRSGRGGVIHG